MLLKFCQSFLFSFLLMTASTLLCHASYIPINNDNAVTNLGIGTSTPQASLVVTNGNVGLGTWTAANARLETDGFKLSTSPSAGYVLVSGSTGIGTWMAASTLATSGGSPGGSSGQIQYNSSSSFAGIANSNVTASGNMGLGTTLSTNKLDVQGGVGIGSTMAGYFAAPANGLAVQGNVGIGTRSAQAGLVITNGNVGIGTWTPSAALSVGKNAFTVASDGSISALSGISGLASAGSVDFTGGQVSNYRFSLFNDCNGCSGDYFGANIGVGNGAGGTGGTFKGLNVDVNNSNSGPVYGIYVNTIASGGINSAGIFMGGNVGIGTFRPVTKLAIAGGVGIGTGLNSAYVSTAAPSGGMIVQGNVGIGTTTPQDKFIVNGGNIGLGTWTTRVPLDIIGIGTTASRGGGVLITNGNLGVNTTVPRAILEVKNSLAYSSVYDNGNSSTAITIDWNTGNNQSVTMTGNCTFTFTAPGGIQRLLLMLTQDGTGSRTATWPAAVKWPGGSAPTLTTTASAVDIISCLYNGTNYYCTDSLDLR